MLNRGVHWMEKTDTQIGIRVTKEFKARLFKYPCTERIVDDARLDNARSFQ